MSGIGENGQTSQLIDCETTYPKVADSSLAWTDKFFVGKKKKKMKKKKPYNSALDRGEGEAIVSHLIPGV